MVETAAFQLKRHENILSSLAGYLSGHTEFVNDFSEGSIVRSLLEGISQELYRQNLAYAQGITDAIRFSVKEAFNQPLLQASKAYGLFTAYRSKLPSPDNLSVSFSSDSASFKGYISGITLTVSSVSSGTIILGQGISEIGVLSGTVITGFLGGTGGIGTYIINKNHTSAVGGPSDLRNFSTYGTFAVPTNFAITSTSSSGSVSANTYYYSITAVFDSVESVSSKIISVTLPVSQNVTLGWTPVANATGYKIYRSINSNMINAKVYSISGQLTSSYTDTDSTGSFGKWPGRCYWWGVSAKNSTNGNILQGSGSYYRGIPTNSIAKISWSEVTSGDKSSAPIGYNVYRSNYDLGFPAITNFSVSGSAGGSLNWGATFNGYAVPYTDPVTGITVAQLTVSSILTGSLSPGQILSHSSVKTGTKILKVVNSTTVWLDISQSFGSSGSPITNIISSPLTYYYSVTALNSFGESIPSESISYVPSSQYQTANLTWDPISGASAYRIYRSITPTFSNENTVFSSMWNVYCFESTTPSFYDNTGTAGGGGSSGFASVYPSIIFIGSTLSSQYSFVDAQIQSSMISVADIPKWSATGNAFSVQGPITIPGGTQLFVSGSAKRYIYPASVTMFASDDYISSVIECTTYGSFGNTGANTISFISNQVYGISSGTNLAAFITGSDIETEEQWKTRFSSALKNLSRGTKDAIATGALSGTLYDENGFISEKVTKSLVVEPSTQSVEVYIFDSTNQSTSLNLISQTQKIINGYTDNQGIYIPGYKPAGMPVIVKAAGSQYQSVTAEVIPNSGYSLLLIKNLIEKNITDYFADLDISDGFQVPVITSITPVGSSGSSIYTYKIVGIDVNGNYSLASDSKTITNAAEPLSNLLTWTKDSTGPTISYYDILRWDGIQWGLVTTLDVTNISGTVTYTDSNIFLGPYSFIQPFVKSFQKSVLTQMIMRTPGVASVKLTVPNSSGIDQNTIIPTIGNILLLNSVTIK